MTLNFRPAILDQLTATLVAIMLNLGTVYSQSQVKYSITKEDSLALENVIVERYYVADSIDYVDKCPLPEGSVTYRIYIDMKPDYTLQAVFGLEHHELFLKTSTTFFNNRECMAETGFNIDPKKIGTGTTAFDSWITMGAATHVHTGVLLADDSKDFSFIKNRKVLSERDGLTMSTMAWFKTYNLDLGFFNNDSIASVFSTSDGVWAALGGIKGPTPDNKVLIAQLTTNGKLSFCINVQIGTPKGGYVQFVAKNPDNQQIKFDGLTYNQ